MRLPVLLGKVLGGVVCVECEIWPSKLWATNYFIVGTTDCQKPVIKEIIIIIIKRLNIVFIHVGCQTTLDIDNFMIIWMIIFMILVVDNFSDS